MSFVFFLVALIILRWLAGSNADLAEAVSLHSSNREEQWRRYVLHRQRTRLSHHDNKT